MVHSKLTAWIATGCGVINTDHHLDEKDPQLICKYHFFQAGSPNFDTHKNDTGHSGKMIVKENSNLAYQGLSHAKLQHSPPRRKAAEMESKRVHSSTSIQQPGAWQIKTLGEGSKKLIWTYIISDNTAAHTAMAFTRPQPAVSEQEPWPKQHHYSYKHRHLAREEIKQGTEWRSTTLRLRRVCFKCVTQTGSPPFLPHRVAGPMFINTVYV